MWVLEQYDDGDGTAANDFVAAVWATKETVDPVHRASSCPKSTFPRPHSAFAPKLPSVALPQQWKKYRIGSHYWYRFGGKMHAVLRAVVQPHIPYRQYLAQSCLQQVQ